MLLLNNNMKNYRESPIIFVLCWFSRITFFFMIIVNYCEMKMTLIRSICTKTSYHNKNHICMQFTKIYQTYVEYLSWGCYNCHIKGKHICMNCLKFLEPKCKWAGGWSSFRVKQMRQNGRDDLPRFGPHINLYEDSCVWWKDFWWLINEIKIENYLKNNLLKLWWGFLSLEGKKMNIVVFSSLH